MHISRAYSWMLMGRFRSHQRNRIYIHTHVYSYATTPRATTATQDAHHTRWVKHRAKFRFLYGARLQMKRRKNQIIAVFQWMSDGWSRCVRLYPRSVCVSVCVCSKGHSHGHRVVAAVYIYITPEVFDRTLFTRNPSRSGPLFCTYIVYGQLRKNNN